MEVPISGRRLDRDSKAQITFIPLENAISLRETRKASLTSVFTAVGQSGEHLHYYKELLGLFCAILYLKVEATRDMGILRIYEAHGDEEWWPTLKAQFTGKCTRKSVDIHYICLP
ncbi:unnamed protein product [Cyclocybe aegerita]|uniref:Uncharacterized protein n=1 Tax=Cyclocybe aegerita TaxID=1973307 RepID=A0A8S0W794_CYCAE|nr:unnamed protein product [Cyclocybe aegerita]